MTCPFNLPELARIGQAIDFPVTDISSATEFEKWRSAAGNAGIGAFARARYVPPEWGVFEIDGQVWALYWDRRPTLCAEFRQIDPPKPAEPPLFSAAYEAALRSACPAWTPPTVASAVYGKTRNGLRFPQRSLLNHDHWQALILARDPGLAAWFAAKRITRPRHLAREFDVAAMTARVEAIEARINADARAMDVRTEKHDGSAPYDMVEVDFAIYLGLQRPEFQDDVRAHMKALSEYVLAWQKVNPPIYRDPAWDDYY